ncbi:hypothetical protein HA402_012393 [Bradysia odoriphaga]|nr:hypothetical protein HA402_012393 [Bradysia odoriphaga]
MCFTKMIQYTVFKIINFVNIPFRLIYWQPVEGLQMRIDIATKRVLEFVNINRNVPVPPAPHFSHSDTDHEMPAANSQPHNSTFEVEGFHVKWKNWNFQYSMDPLHGLQLYHIRHIADCEERFLIYNIKISEMFVPYGASGYTWRWREVFDTGVYGLGKNASPIMLGIDAPPYAKVLPCTKYNDLTGEVSELENCIALYERPVWPEYYHYDIGSDTHYARAGTELVIMSMCTVGNYVYMWEYVFKMDGTIMVMVMATGIVLNRAVINEKNDPNCIEECLDYINEHSIGPVHQHFVNYRIDFDIDGASNTLMQVDFVQDPRSLDNYDGGAFSARRTIIPRETFLDSSPINSRFWNIINQQSRNVFNTPRGYSIRPDSLAFTFAMDTLSKAEFVKHPIWVTLHNDDEQGAAADFPRSRKKNQGLPDYIKDGASVRNADLVFWYSLGFSHLPRPEEFPIMDTHKASLHVSPTNFHSANPLITTRC